MSLGSGPVPEVPSSWHVSTQNLPSAIAWAWSLPDFAWWRQDYLTATQKLLHAHAGHMDEDLLYPGGPAWSACKSGGYACAFLHSPGYAMSAGQQVGSCSLARLARLLDPAPLSISQCACCEETGCSLQPGQCALSCSEWRLCLACQHD